MIAKCVECGANRDETPACLDCFHALLAFENERPEAFGAVHHLTVACYFLQHPAGYPSETLDAWQELVAASLNAHDTPRALQRRMGRKFDGSTKVRAPAAVPPSWWPATWSMHVADLLRPYEELTTDEYVRRARRWAAQTLATLEQARLAAR